MFGTPRNTSDPLQSKRFLAFLFGVFLAYLLGTRKLTHFTYLGIIGFLLYFGHRPAVVGLNGGFIAASVAAIGFSLLIGGAINQIMNEKC